MKLLSKDEIRAWDQHTIALRGINSFDLMKHASECFCEWFSALFADSNRPVVVFCGPGNNGGDGFCISTLLRQRGYSVKTYLCAYSDGVSSDNLLAQEFCKHFDNLKRAEEVHIDKGGIIIDALFGSGIAGALRPAYEKLARTINKASEITVSVDIPSGLDPDIYNRNLSIVADYCLSFEVPKKSFFFHDNSKSLKRWTYRRIGLSQDYLNDLRTSDFYIDRVLIKGKLKQRSAVSSKVNFGFGQLSGGSEGMYGAVILASKAAMRTGLGRLIVNLPSQYEASLINAVPEVMVSSAFDEGEVNVYTIPNKNVNAFAIGPGLGTSKAAVTYIDSMLGHGLNNCVLDADALNIIARNNWQDKIPSNTIITPHQYEFERLFGKSENHYERIKKQRLMAREHKIYIILKGHYTTICTPTGDCYYNSTGNVGMATAGSGDVLTGMLLSLLAQGYSYSDACLLGVYCHGLAGNMARDKYGEISLMASDIIEYIPIALKTLYETT